MGADTVRARHLRVIAEWESVEALDAHGVAPHMAAYAAKTKEMVMRRDLRDDRGLTLTKTTGRYFDGARAAEGLAALGQARDFIKEQFRHCKQILTLGTGRKVAERAGVVAAKQDWALVSDVRAFIQAVGRHRNWDRAVDPPKV